MLANGAGDLDLASSAGNAKNARARRTLEINMCVAVSCFVLGKLYKTNRSGKDTDENVVFALTCRYVAGERAEDHHAKERERYQDKPNFHKGEDDQENNAEDRRCPRELICAVSAAHKIVQFVHGFYHSFCKNLFHYIVP